MFAQKSDKLLTKILVPKLKLKIESNKLKQVQKYMELGISKWSFITLLKQKLIIK